jgi:hypothetical protein
MDTFWNNQWNHLLASIPKEKIPAFKVETFFSKFVINEKSEQKFELFLRIGKALQRELVQEGGTEIIDNETSIMDCIWIDEWMPSEDRFGFYKTALPPALQLYRLKWAVFEEKFIQEKSAEKYSLIYRICEAMMSEQEALHARWAGATSYG